MAKVTGFLEHERVESSSISPNKYHATMLLVA